MTHIYLWCATSSPAFKMSHGQMMQGQSQLQILRLKFDKKVKEVETDTFPININITHLAPTTSTPMDLRVSARTPGI